MRYFVLFVFLTIDISVLGCRVDVMVFVRLVFW